MHTTEPTLRPSRLLDALPGDGSGDRTSRTVDGAWALVQPTPVPAPRMLAWSAPVAGMLGLPPEAATSPDWLAALSGNRLLPGMQPYASAYGGHQFGHWAGQLGDGRAIALGDVLAPDGQRYELQLKGAGPTPFSRGSDGRAVLRSSLREFVASEAMHALGVPTTRALSLVATGEDVLRDILYDGRVAPEPGAIVCRVAPSFLRPGHIELPAAQGDSARVAQWVDLCIAWHAPQLDGAPAQRRGDWFIDICERTARLMAEWMRVGFVHGVMNTDNLSLLGLTLDYGPFGFVEAFDPDWTPNLTDAQRRRYRFGQQPAVAYWNLQRFAAALAGVAPDSALEQGLQRYIEAFREAQAAATAAKLGLTRPDAAADAEIETLLRALFRHMHAVGADYTLWFRALSEAAPGELSLDALRARCEQPESFDAQREAVQDWLRDYAALAGRLAPDESARVARMDAANPLYVPRNWLMQVAIDAAAQGDTGPLDRLVSVLRQPYVRQDGADDLAGLRPAWARDLPGCGQLSCSS